VRDGDQWVVRGQKVWTSNAHYSDWGILLARTDVDAPKHRGITCFLVDMRSEGIDIRPLRQATGSAEFNEVFLTDLRVPDSQRLGDIDDGWRVALSTLTEERSSIGGNSRMIPFGEVAALARAFGRTDDAVARQRLAAFYTREQILTWLGWRARTAISQGQAPGPESSVAKLAMSGHLEAMGNLVLELQGATGMADAADAAEGGRWQGQFLYQWASRIGGGTDQVQRNILGERVLGLPREPSIDKGLAFKDIAHN
jgi:alkylation response protein AidB-like acyl-CoA dehydrogenase